MTVGFAVFLDYWLLFLGSFSLASFSVLVVFQEWLKSKRVKLKHF